VSRRKQCTAALATPSTRTSSQCRIRSTAYIAQSSPSRCTLHRDHAGQIKPRTLSRAFLCCPFAPSPHSLSSLSSADEAIAFPGKQSPWNLAGARVVGEAVGRHRPPLPALLLLCLIPLLRLELTSCSVLCLAELGRRHRRRNLKVTIDEPASRTTSSHFSCRNRTRRRFREPAAALQLPSHPQRP
jgi:hypothetical protein